MEAEVHSPIEGKEEFLVVAVSETCNGSAVMEDTAKSAESREPVTNDEGENEEASNSSGELARVCLEGCKCPFCEKFFNEEKCGEEVEINCLRPSTLMTVPVVIKESKISALVDTACSTSVIQEEYVHEVISVTDRRAIHGLDQVRVMSRGQIKLSFTIGGIEFSSDFIVLPTGSIKNPIILGNNFFSENNVEIDLASLRLSGGNVHGWWDMYFDEEPSVYHREIPVYVSVNCIVQTGKEMLIEVELPTECSQVINSDDMYFDPLVTVEGDIHLSAVILSISDRRFQLLGSRGYKAKSHEYMFKKGTLVGYLSTIVDVTVAEEMEGESVLVEELDLSHLGEMDRQKVKSMLLSKKQIISTNDMDIGCAGVTKHKIVLYDNTPIRQNKRRYPPPVVDEIERQCEELLSMDIIEYSKSPYSAPVVPIRKKDGSLRMCIDYRKLNAVTKPDSFPMPVMQDLVFSMHGNRYFTTLDLVKGYYQVPLDPDGAECTAFSTTRNHYQFKRLAFGLKNAPSAFQREMQSVLAGFDSKNVVVFIDDILIVSDSFEKHLHLVGQVLTTMANYGIKIKLSKCSFY